MFPPGPKKTLILRRSACTAIFAVVDSLNASNYSLYLMDYEAPVGHRLALRHSDRVQDLIVQNGNAYEEGLREFWGPIKKYWNDGLPESRAAIHFLVDAKSTRWLA